MAHTFVFTVTVDVEPEEGEYASREEVTRTLTDRLDGADQESFSCTGPDGAPSYNTATWHAHNA